MAYQCLIARICTPSTWAASLPLVNFVVTAHGICRDLAAGGELELEVDLHAMLAERDDMETL